jgi:hypothetical protein
VKTNINFLLLGAKVFLELGKIVVKQKYGGCGAVETIIAQ